MYPDATTVTELAGYLDLIERIPYRCMVERIEGEFQITRLIIGSQASWHHYDYSDVLFIAGIERGEVVANWLRSGRFTNLYNNSFPILPISTSVYSYRHPSHSRGGTFTFSKPFTSYQVSFSKTPMRQDYILASEKAPFFLTVQEAERHLLYEIPEGSYSIQAPEAAVYVYIEHPDAWLERIHFSLTSLELHLAGRLLNDTKLKVVGSGIVGYDDYPMQNVVSIPLPNGRPDYLNVALIRRNIWLDYFINNKNSPPNPFSLKRTNVTFVEPEPQEKVRELIDRGEGKTIEFKHELKSSEKMKWLKTIIAFANGEGGSLIIGINDDDGTVVGIHPNNLNKHQGSIAKFKDEITNAIHDNIEPVPEFEFVDATIDGHGVLVVNVRTTTGKCYVSYQNNVPVYYIRRAATTRVADHNEVQDLIKAKIPVVLPSSPINALSFRNGIQ